MISLPKAVRHLTTTPARRLGLTDRGKIAPGYKADLVIFDPAEIKANATYADPRRLATGIDHVLVNGQWVWREGSATRTAAGRHVGGRTSHEVANRCA